MALHCTSLSSAVLLPCSLWLSLSLSAGCPMSLNGASQAKWTWPDHAVRTSHCGVGQCPVCRGPGRVAREHGETEGRSAHKTDGEFAGLANERDCDRLTAEAEDGWMRDAKCIGDVCRRHCVETVRSMRIVLAFGLQPGWGWEGELHLCVCGLGRTIGNAMMVASSEAWRRA
ncbi:hypothetical protein BDP55DRAFT_633854 [Colletotrichum godetiae]|uniref:Secreted protein n=1 Tax=Colletotrichum godetiae TaxID=1209918 RepID=A0AAJ0AKV8_9PEZI|nr:uncharacterized protein BDP55DRAFT_633854 [Colletotrichum godetiae]KAK1673576.1 hypothetical protein BDP55DRAFT_633854 [Colletotrichum godetiae]